MRRAWPRLPCAAANDADVNAFNRLLKPADFDPFHKPSRPVKVDVSVLKDVFIDRRMPEVAKETRA